MTTCALTGHRPAHFSFQDKEQHPDCVALKVSMREQISQLAARGVTTFLTGMALGVETWGAEIVLELKEKDPRLKLVAVLPCETQANKWTERQRERYFDILARCDEAVYVRRRYRASCMLERNRYLVEHSEILLAVYDGAPGSGTAYTVGYAQQKSREVILLLAQNCNSSIDIEEILVRE